MTHVWFAVGPFEAAVCGVQRDVVSVGQLVVGAEAFVAPPVAATPNQLQRKILTVSNKKTGRSKRGIENNLWFTQFI